MTGDVRSVKKPTELDKWCWKQKGSTLSNEELFSLARKIGGKSEMGRDEIEKSLEKASSEESQNISENAQRSLDEYTERQIAEAFNKATSKGKGGKGREDVPASELNKSPVERSGGKNDSHTLQHLAQSILGELGSGLSNERRNEMQDVLKEIKHAEHLLEFIKKIESELKPGEQKRQGYGFNEKSFSGDDTVEGIPGSEKKEGEMGSPVNYSQGNDSVPAEEFKRFPDNSDSRELFDGVQTSDSEEGCIGRSSFNVHVENYLDFFDDVKALSSHYHRLKRKIHKHLPPEISKEEIRSMVEQLIETHVISPTLKDTFLVNQERVAYLLAKDAFLNMSKFFNKRHAVRTGMHKSGIRGLQTVQLDRTQRARHLTSRLAPSHTLRRGLTRRILYPSSHLLDEDDLMEYASRKKVGYSVVLAIDISGAVQFGERIQGVRKACMAFGYYLKRFQPYDRVRCIAYHEIAREIRFSDVPRLRAVNGTGKDIGGCLEKSRKILLKDPDRIPVVILIGDGLPVRGENAGFYRFMENNREIIEKAYHNASLLWKEGILFTFFQFREDRHLWQEYSDEAAKKITKEARGILYRIDDPGDIATSLINTYDSLRNTCKQSFNRGALMRCQCL